MVKKITKWLAIIGGGGITLTIFLFCLYILLFVNAVAGFAMLFGFMLMVGVLGFILNEIIQDMGMFKK